MSLLSDNTHWILLSASDDESEERHIFDIAFGVYCLETKGINSKNITLLIDGKDRNRIISSIQIASNFTHTILYSNDLFSVISNNSSKNIVLIITGHGNIEGITSPNNIKPFHLIQALKTSPKLKVGIVYLGQCYAGIFNYMMVGNKENSPPKIVIMGATNLFHSISSPTNEQFLTQKKSWSANLFLLNLFQWIKSPVDVDGDGKNTVMDSYKFASSKSNDTYKLLKSFGYIEPLEKFVHLSTLKKQINDHPTKDDSDPIYAQLLLELDAAQKDYLNTLNIQFNHQESWVLNSIPAQEIEF